MPKCGVAGLNFVVSPLFLNREDLIIFYNFIIVKLNFR